MQDKDYSGFSPEPPVVTEIDVSKMDFKDLTSGGTIETLSSIVDDQTRFDYILKLEERAKELKQLANFRRWLKLFAGERPRPSTKIEMRDLPVRDYEFGDYYIGDKGVAVYDDSIRANVYFTHTPIVLTKLLRNIDDGTERVVLKFKKHNRWHEVTVPKQQICSGKDIVALSQYGVNITSTKANYMVDYLSQLEAFNIDILTEQSSVSRLGWYGNEFIPYAGALDFDGENKDMFDAVKASGDYARWYDAVKAARSNLVVRLVLNTSLASPLIERMRKQIFFLHLWGGTEVGKSVALNVAMSVWGDCDKLVNTFNSTLVGFEKKAAFLKNLPFALDEFQTVKDKFYNSDKMIYQLSGGRSKGRGTKSGGTERVSEWALTIITNGEQPLTEDSSGGGSKNRAVEVYCKNKLFKAPAELMAAIHENYGHAGMMYIDKLKQLKYEELDNVFRLLQRVLVSCGNLTDKQLNSVALLGVADWLWNMVFEGMEHSAAMNEAAVFLQDCVPLLTNAETVKLGERAYQAFCAWVAQNKNKFDEHVEVGEIYGKLDTNDVFVLPLAFKRFCDENNYSNVAVLNEFENKGVLDVESPKEKRRSLRINSRPTKAYKIKLEREEIQLDVDVAEGIFGESRRI